MRKATHKLKIKIQRATPTAGQFITCKCLTPISYSSQKLTVNICNKQGTVIVTASTINIVWAIAHYADQILFHVVN